MADMSILPNELGITLGVGTIVNGTGGGGTGGGVEYTAGEGIWIKGHVINADVTQAELDGKAAVDHKHVIADVDGLQAALDAKASASEVSALGTKLPAFTSGTAAGLDSSYFSGGAVTWERYGDLVVVSITIVVSKKLVHGVVIATGLPKPRKARVVNLTQWTDSTGANTMRVSLGTNGTLSVHYSGNSPSGNQYYGQVVYVAAD